MAIDMKQIIAQKYAEISDCKSLDKVTVTELVEACGISRQAFYYHFRDIVDVALWLTESKMREGLELSLRETTLENEIRQFLTIFSENREQTRKRLASKMHREFEQLFQQIIRDFLQEIAARGETRVPYADFAATMEFCTGGVYQMLLKYAGESEQADRWLVRQLFRLISHELRLDTVEKE